ncbi:MAG: hypothetical protein LBH93_01600 [Chitinispirillales bacterium]|nr:hypothetical protein [Chitinispirillales bacterium]
MAALRWNNLVGQERVKAVFEFAFQKETLGHAYLFCGERGIGKFAAAVDLAMAVLCKGAEARPCGECPSCKKVKAYSHPDFHVIMPLVLGAEHKKDGVLTDEGWALAASSAKARIEDPYRLQRYDGIPDIPVEWVREANHAVMRGATAGPSNALIIDGVESMRKESANAMLKTLEEPPPGTLMVLLTDKLHAVLPTIASRCQIIRFPLLPPDAIRAELRRRLDGGGNANAAVETAAASGSLGIAIEELENPLDEYYELAASLWNDCLRGGWGSAAKSAENLSFGKDSFTTCRNTLSCLIQLIRFAFLKKFGQTASSINYIAVEASYQIELPKAAVPADIEHIVQIAQRAFSDLEARGNAMLIMANLVCTLMETLNGEEQ